MGREELNIVWELLHQAPPVTGSERRKVFFDHLFGSGLTFAFRQRSILILRKRKDSKKGDA
jgi:hypothetical protein